MRLLAIDAATERCSAAILCGAAVLARSSEGAKAHGAEILAMVDALLAESGLTLTALDAVAAGVGPGAFTGVRVGVSIAQGLAFGASLPVVPISTLESLAFRLLAGHRPETPQGGGGRSRRLRALACLDARMGEVYWGAYAGDEVRGVTALLGPRVDAPDELVRWWQRGAGARTGPEAEQWRGIGKGFSAHPAPDSLAGLALDAADAMALPDARDTVTLGALRFAAGEALDPAGLTPLYVRDKVALTEAERRAK